MICMKKKSEIFKLPEPRGQHLMLGISHRALPEHLYPEMSPGFVINSNGANKKIALYLSVNVFSTKVQIGDTIFTCPTGNGTAILRGRPRHAKI